MNTHRVNIEIDERIWKRFRQMAIAEETKTHILFNEALATYLKWMQRAEIEERREAGKVQEVTSLQIEQLETQRIIESWRREKMSYERKQFWANKKAKEKLLEGKAYRRGKYNREVKGGEGAEKQ